MMNEYETKEDFLGRLKYIRYDRDYVKEVEEGERYVVCGGRYDNTFFFTKKEAVEFWRDVIKPLRKADG